jgi:hypothetical protein
MNASPPNNPAQNGKELTMNKVLALVAVLMIFPACAGGKFLTKRPVSDNAVLANAPTEHAAAEKQLPTKSDAAIEAFRAEMQKMKDEQMAAKMEADTRQLEMKNQLNEARLAIEAKDKQLADLNAKLVGKVEVNQTNMLAPGNVVVTDRTSGATPGFIRTERFPVMYADSWPIGLKVTDNLHVVMTDTLWHQNGLEPEVGRRKAFVALPTITSDVFVVTDPNGNVGYGGQGPAFSIIVVGSDGRTMMVPPENGVYHVTVSVPGMSGLLTRQMAVADDHVSPPRLSDVLLPGQYGFTELKEGVTVSGNGYTFYSDPSMPMEKVKEYKPVKVFRSSKDVVLR